MYQESLLYVWKSRLAGLFRRQVLKKYLLSVIPDQQTSGMTVVDTSQLYCVVVHYSILWSVIFQYFLKQAEKGGNAGRAGKGC